MKHTPLCTIHGEFRNMCPTFSQRGHEITVITLRGSGVLVVLPQYVEHAGFSNLVYSVVISFKNKCTHAGE